MLFFCFLSYFSYNRKRTEDFFRAIQYNEGKDVYGGDKVNLVKLAYVYGMDSDVKDKNMYFSGKTDSGIDKEDWVVPWAPTNDPYKATQVGEGYYPMGGRQYVDYRNFYDPTASDEKYSKMTPSRRMWEVLKTPIGDDAVQSNSANAGILQTMEKERQKKYNQVLKLVGDSNGKMTLDEAVDRVTVRDGGAYAPSRPAKTPFSYNQFSKEWNKGVFNSLNAENEYQSLKNSGVKNIDGRNLLAPEPLVGKPANPLLYGLGQGMNTVSRALTKDFGKAFENRGYFGNRANLLRGGQGNEYYWRPSETQQDYKQSGLGRVSSTGKQLPLGLKNLGEAAATTTAGFGFSDDLFFGRPAGETIPSSQQTRGQRLATLAGWFAPTAPAGNFAGMGARALMRGTSAGMKGLSKGMDSAGMRGIKSFTPSNITNQAKRLTSFADDFRTVPKMPDIKTNKPPGMIQQFKNNVVDGFKNEFNRMKGTVPRIDRPKTQPTPQPNNALPKQPNTSIKPIQPIR